MSRRAEIRRHLAALVEIEAIMRAMKNLSLTETHKLARYSVHQLRVLDTIERALLVVSASDRVVAPSRGQGGGVLLAIGSERGFCGDFNEALVQAIQRRRQEPGGRDEALIVVGARLLSRLAGARAAASFHGANVAEEVPGVLQRVVASLNEAVAGGDRQAAQSLSVLAHLEHSETPVLRDVFPPRRSRTVPGRDIAAPGMLIPPVALYAELLQHYLWAVLHASFYGSLMAENRKRLQHMERAINRLQDRAQELRRRANLLRQEEITEEIEVIMLSGEALRGAGPGQPADHSPAGIASRTVAADRGQIPPPDE